MKKSKKNFALFFGILVVCKLYYWFFTFPNPDEAYYWLWGQKPALSYHDHPAMFALTQGWFHQLFGNSLFVLRLPAFLFTLISIWIYVKILQKLTPNTSISPILLGVFCTPLIFMFTTFAWHDVALICLCLCSGYFWMQFLTDTWTNKQGKTTDILGGFLFLGLAALCKYNAVFLALGLATLLLSNKNLHRIFKDPRFYLGILFCLVIISPIFIWNHQNNYGSFQFTLGQRTLQPFVEKRFFKGNSLGFLMGTFALVSPFVVFAFFKSMWGKQNPENLLKTSYSIVYKKLAKHVFVASTLVFLLLSTFSNVLYYWNIVAYLFALPLAIIYLASHPVWLKTTFIYSLFINVLIVFHLGVLPLTSFLKNTEDKDGAYHYGWNKIAKKVQKQSEIHPKKTTLFANSYRTASLLAFALDRKDVYAYSSRFDQFDYWTKNTKYNSKNALFLTDEKENLCPEILDIIENPILSDSIIVQKWGFPIKNYYVYSAEIKKAHRN